MGDKLVLESPVSSCSTIDTIPRNVQDVALCDHRDGDELSEPQHDIAEDVLSTPPLIKLKFTEMENHRQCLVNDGFMLPPSALECNDFSLDHCSGFFEEGFLMPPLYASQTD